MNEMDDRNAFMHASIVNGKSNIKQYAFDVSFSAHPVSNVYDIL